MTITPWRRSALILAGILAGELVYASTGTLYQFERALLPALTSAPLAAVMLDAPIYAGCQPDLCDLRLVENGAREQPYYVEQVMAMQPQVEQVAQPADIVTMRELPGNALEIVFQLGGENPGVSGLRVSTPLRDFERSVAVYVGATTQAWQLAVADALLFDYARYMDVAQHEVRLPQHAAGRFVKLVISAVTDETRSALARVTHEWHAGNATNVRETVDLTRRAFRIDHVTMWQDVTREAVREAVVCSYPITDLTVTQDVKNGMTTLEFSAARAPLTAVSIVTPDRNFRRQARLYAQATAPPHQATPIAAATLSSLQLGPFSRTALALSFPETRAERYRLQISNDNNPLLAITGVVASGTVYRLVFVPQAGAHYALRYGAPQASMPRYDLGALLSELQARPDMQVWQLAAPVAHVVAPITACWWNDHRTHILFSAAMVVIVVVLVWALWYAARRVQQLPHE